MRRIPQQPPNSIQVRQREARLKARRQQQRTWIVTLVIGLFVAGTGVAWYLHSQGEKIRRLEARVTYLEGDVTVLGADGARRPVKLGETVAVGRGFRTGQGAEMDIGIRNPNGRVGGIKLDEETEATFEQLEGGETALELDRGRVFHRLHSLPARSEFKLTTPSGQVVVRGTEFFVEIDETGTLVATREGRVGAASVGDLASEIGIETGKMASVSTSVVDAVEPVGDREKELFKKIDQIDEGVGESGDRAERETEESSPSRVERISAKELVELAGTHRPEHFSSPPNQAIGAQVAFAELEEKTLSDQIRIEEKELRLSQWRARRRELYRSHAEYTVALSSLDGNSIQINENKFTISTEEKKQEVKKAVTKYSRNGDFWLVDGLEETKTDSITFMFRGITPEAIEDAFQELLGSHSDR